MQLPISGFPLALLGVFLCLPAAQAFPPAPNGLIYGMVKDQYGTPLLTTSSRVILQTPGGVQVVAIFSPNLAIGVNYAISVPMDAAITPQPYVPNALTVAAQYKLYVAVGTATNLPIEMVGPYAVLGNPAAQVRQDLTLGTDANGDGIPDAWENVFLASIGTNLALAKLNPGTDYAHTGRTLKQEYLIGNFPFNPDDDFGVTLVSLDKKSAVLGFTTMVARTYTALGSSDLKSWTTLNFTVPTEGATPPVHTSYYSPDIHDMQIHLDLPTNGPSMQFFRLLLQ